MSQISDRQDIKEYGLYFLRQTGKMWLQVINFTLSPNKLEKMSSEKSDIPLWLSGIWVILTIIITEFATSGLMAYVNAVWPYIALRIFVLSLILAFLSKFKFMNALSVSIIIMLPSIIIYEIADTFIHSGLSSNLVLGGIIAIYTIYAFPRLRLSQSKALSWLIIAVIMAVYLNIMMFLHT